MKTESGKVNKIFVIQKNLDKKITSTTLLIDDNCTRSDVVTIALEQFFQMPDKKQVKLLSQYCKK